MAAQPLNTGNSLAINYNQVNQLITDVNNRKVTEIFKDDSGIQRVLLGKGSNGFYGLKVSQGGIDVYTATDDELIFNSDQDIFKIVKTLSFSITQAANSQTSYSKAHSQTSVPAIMGFLAAGANIFRPLPTRTSLVRNDTDGNVYMNTWVECQADLVNVTINFFNASSSNAGPFNFKVFVLQETAA